MSLRINDYVEFIYNDNKIGGNVISTNDDLFSVNALIDGKVEVINNINKNTVLRIISNTVLCYIEKDDYYLMLLRNKRKDDMNSGKWIGVGGHIENGETKDEALLREVKEETNLDLIDYKLRGVIYFHDDNYMEIMNLYTSKSFNGNLKECDEGTLKWVKKDEIMDLNLWEGDKSFLPLLIKNEPYFEMELFYEKGILKRINKF